MSERGQYYQPTGQCFPVEVVRYFQRHGQMFAAPRLFFDELLINNPNAPSLVWKCGQVYTESIIVLNVNLIL